MTTADSDDSAARPTRRLAVECAVLAVVTLALLVGVALDARSAPTHAELAETALTRGDDDEGVDAAYALIVRSQLFLPGASDEVDRVLPEIRGRTYRFVRAWKPRLLRIAIEGADR